MLRSALAAVFLLAALSGIASAQQTYGTWPFVGHPPTPYPHPTPLPSGQILVGGFFRAASSPSPKPTGLILSGAQIQENNQETLETLVGHSLPIDLIYGSPTYFVNSGSKVWGPVGAPIDPRIIASIALKRTPIVSWSAGLPTSSAESLASYLPAAVAESLGFPAPPPSCATNPNSSTQCYEKWDSYIDAFAQRMKAYPGPIYARPFHEFDQCLSSAKCSNNDSIYDFPAIWPATGMAPTDAQKGELFQAWYEYVYYRSVYIDGATNIMWLWNPTGGNPSLTENFFPKTCYVLECAAPIDGSYDVDMIGDDQYDVGNANGLVNTYQSVLQLHDQPVPGSPRGLDREC